MFDALQIAATGMQAQQAHVDTVANNLANVNTVGFKKARVGFQDLVTRGNDALPASPTGAGSTGATLAPSIGIGVVAGHIARSFEPGELRRTDAPLDLAISGRGFLEVTLPDGGRAYSRGGSLKVDADGLLTTQAGYALKPAVSIPDNVTEITIAADGKVFVQADKQFGPVQAGQLELVRFANPDALTPLGDGIFRANDDTGEPIANRLGDENAGLIKQGYLEGSNVKLVDEMVNLMVAQRAYEANVKVVQAADEMQGLINTLRK